MAVTIKDIARITGVSISTVSRVINNSKPVNSEVRQRVLSIMNELNFRPNAMARGLVKNESGLIGMIAPAITNTVFSEMIDGVSKVAKLYEYDILLSLTEGELEKEIHYLNLHREKHVDGIILSAHSLKDEHIEIIKQSQIPCVLVGQVSHVPSIPSVHVDNFSASYEAVRSLLQEGHRKIAMIRGPKGDMAAGEERFRGYSSAITDEGIPVKMDWVVTSGFSVQDGYNAMKQIMESGSMPTALFAAADRIAIGAMNYMLENGFDIPNDLSIVGFDDIDMSAIVRPKLSTIHYSFQEVGMTAFRNLIKLIKKEEVAAQHTNIPHHLIIRDSVKQRND